MDHRVLYNSYFGKLFPQRSLDVQLLESSSLCTLQQKERKVNKVAEECNSRTNKEEEDSEYLLDKKLERKKIHITKRLELMNPRAWLKMILYHRAKTCIFTNSGDKLFQTLNRASKKKNMKTVSQREDKLTNPWSTITTSVEWNRHSIVQEMHLLVKKKKKRLVKIGQNHYIESHND